MRVKLWCYAALIAVIAAFVATPTLSGQAVETAAEPVAGFEFIASANDVDKGVKLEAMLFIPKEIKTLRGAIVVVAHGRSYLIYESSAWRRAAASIDVAVLHARVTTISQPPGPMPPNRQIMRLPSLGGGDLLVAALRQLAKESRHPEVANLPLAFWGWSAAGGFGSTFAEQYPERTLGFIRVRTAQRELPVNLDVIKGIPGLFIAGGQDQTAGVEDAQALWKGGRKIGAPWTFIVEPHVPHGLIDGPKKIEFVSNDNQLMIPWLTEIIRQRLPQGGTALRPISDRAGWVGDNQTGEIWPSDGFSGSKLDKTWLPDEPSARAWQQLRIEQNPSRPFDE